MTVLPFFTVRQDRVALVQRFGKLSRVARPGLNVKLPVLESVAGFVPLGVQHVEVRVETKTRDQVVVQVILSVKFRAMPDRVLEAFSSFEDPAEVIRSVATEVVRQKVADVELDAVFRQREEIAAAVRDELEPLLEASGYAIARTVVHRHPTRNNGRQPTPGTEPVARQGLPAQAT